MNTYDIEYDLTPIASVGIDAAKAEEPIKEMVEFWGGWEDAVDENDGDYTKTWLQNLALFIIRNGRLPTDDEGWTPLDGTHGITIKTWDAWRPDRHEISIE